jgi:hypothetical protein
VVSITARGTNFNIMTQKEELRILRELLWKIGDALIRAECKIEDNGGDRIKKILSEIRYGYCYGQSNSCEGESMNAAEKARIRSLKRLDRL